MKVTKLAISDVLLLQPNVYKDNRGLFYEYFNQELFEKNTGLMDTKFVQDNYSLSKRGVVRGLHYQSTPFEQDKLIGVLSGEIFDVAVDIRPNSKTYGKWVGQILSEQNKSQLWIPKGFAHGFLVISECATVMYKVTNQYSKDHERIIIWNDKDINIQWPKMDHYILSEKDGSAGLFKDGGFF